MKKLLLPASDFMMVRELVAATAAATIAGLNRSGWTPSGILLDQAQDMHMRALVGMAKGGQICLLDVLFHTRLPPDFEQKDADACMVSFADAQIFCRSIGFDLQPQPDEAVPAPVVREEAEAAPAHEPIPTASAPAPLTTGEIAACFAGLRWDEGQWKKPLGDKPKWLAACIAIPGRRGVSETRWNPVLLGGALVRDGYTKANSVRARFQTKASLVPWLETWKTYEADQFDNN